MTRLKALVWSIRQFPAQERVGFDQRSPWWGEHRSRYQFAAPHVRGRVVLDFACGSGLGMEVLAEAGAELVIGADIFEPAIRNTLSLIPDACGVVGDATRIPLRQGAAEIITSFETIEHIEDDLAFVSELRRVLSPDGTLYLSTPNSLFTERLKGPRNPFHIREYSPGELLTLLRNEFDHVSLLGQRTHPRYLISPYWQLPEDLPTDPTGRLKVLSWKLRRRLPFRIRDGMSRLMHNLAFYPGEFDFEFTETAVERGHALLAVCR